MSLLRSKPFLVMLVTLLFAAGYGEQIFGRFVRHHHEVQVRSEADGDDHDDGDHHQDDSDQKKKSDNHRLEHLAAIGTVPPLVLTLVVNLQQTGLVVTSVASRVEAPVRGIDYPPQLG